MKKYTVRQKLAIFGFFKEVQRKFDQKNDLEFISEDKYTPCHLFLVVNV